MTRSRLPYLVALASLTSSSAAQQNAAVQTAQRIGISPERLAAVGANATDASAILGRLDATTDATTAYRAAEAALDAAELEHASALDAWRTVRSDENLSRLTSARAALAQSRATYRQNVTDLRGEALADAVAGSSDRTLLGITDPSALRTPAWFLTVSSDRRECSRLVCALIAEQRSQRTGEPLDSEHRAIIDAAWADTGGVQARARTQANLAAIQAVYDGWGR